MDPNDHLPPSPSNDILFWLLCAVIIVFGFLFVFFRLTVPHEKPRATIEPLKWAEFHGTRAQAPQR